MSNLKQMMKLLKCTLIFTLLISCSLQTDEYCLEYPSLSQELQFRYCGSAIQWPVSTLKMLDDDLHDQALLRYKEVYQEYIKDPSNTNQFSGVTVDCLGIMRKSLCAHYFPYCVVDDPKSEQVHIVDFDGSVSATESEDTNTARVGSSNPGMCKSLCGLIEARCPTVSHIFDEICEGQRNDNCSKSRFN